MSFIHHPHDDDHRNYEDHDDDDDDDDDHDHDHDDDDDHHHITFIHLYDMSEINFTKANVQVDLSLAPLPQW